MLSNKSVLILYDFSHFVTNGSISFERISKLFSIVFFFKENVLTLNDRDGEDIKGLLKDNIGLETVCKLTHNPLEKIDYMAYNIIICTPYMENELMAVFRKKYTTGDCEGLPVYCFDSSFDYKPSLFNWLSELLPTGALKPHSISNIFVGTKNLRQEDFFKPEVEEITMQNERNIENSLKNILILDDYYRNFFIGDAYLWLCGIKEFIQRLPHYRVVINCFNKERYERINEIFQHSFGDDISFENNSWNSIDFSAFNLILCHGNVIYKFLHFFKEKRIVEPTFLHNTIIYRFSPNALPHEIDDRYNWDSNLLISRVKSKNKSFETLRAIRNQKHKELPISDGERAWGDTWLMQNGYTFGSALFILIDEASVKEKVLDFEATIHLMKGILTLPCTQILLFDYQQKDKKRKLKEYFNEAEQERILVANKMGIRKEMCILSSSYIKGIVGPCTGFMHLANGVYTYLKNNHKIAKDNLPLLLVYTGTGFDVHNYHPIYWWHTSLVKCIIPVKHQNIVKTIELPKAPLGVSIFQETCLPVKYISPNMVLPYIQQKVQLQKL